MKGVPRTQEEDEKIPVSFKRKKKKGRKKYEILIYEHRYLNDRLIYNSSIVYSNSNKKKIYNRQDRHVISQDCILI